MRGTAWRIERDVITSAGHLLMRQVANMVQTGLCEELFKQNVPEQVLEAVSLLGRKRLDKSTDVDLGTKD